MTKVYPIQGMTCASCAQKVEKTLNQLPQVKAQINLATEEVFLDHPEEYDIQVLKEAVEKAGYQLIIQEDWAQKIPGQRQHFTLQGIHCSACASKIEVAVGQLSSILSSSVNPATEILTVEWQDQPDPDAVYNTVKLLGYQANLVLSGQERYAIQATKKAERLSFLKQRLLWMLAFTLPLFIFTMGPMIGMPLPGFLAIDQSPLNNALVQWALTSPVMVLAYPVFKRGFKSLFRGHPNMESLIALGTAAAYIQGLVVLIFLAVGLVNGPIQLYFESAAVILTLFTFGQYMETLAKGQTSRAIKELMDLAPETARVIQEDGSIQDLAVQQVRVGDRVQVKPGDRIPLDGVILSGESSVDESMITGESMPVTKRAKDPVIGASLNKNGSFVFEVTHIGTDTTLAQIIQRVQDAQGSKAPIARLADRISAYFVPTVMVLAVLAFVFWYLVMGESLSFALQIFISVLIIACPCALGLATPTAIMVGTGKAAQAGILFKNGQALEHMQSVDTLLLDKTGTLTQGQPTVTDIQSLGPYSPQRLVAYLAAAELHSEHPLAQGIVAYARTKNISLPEGQAFESLTGFGITARVQGKKLAAGNARLMDSLGIDRSPGDKWARQWSQEGKTSIYLAIDGSLSGMVAVADALKSDSPEAIASFRNRGLEVVMVTGDNQKTAQAIAKKAGIKQLESQVLPEDKASLVAHYQDQGSRVMMVGDGINDAPALAQADIGVAIGSGTDVALESAEVVLMHDSLMDVDRALRISQATLKTIRENLFWAFAYNAVGIPIAMGCLYLFFEGPLMSPMFAALAMSLSSLSVLLNSLRLRWNEKI